MVVKGVKEQKKRIKKIDAEKRKSLDTMIKRETLAGEKYIKRLYSGPVLKVRSGLLRASVHHLFEKRKDGLRSRLSTATRYALKHERGGKVRAGNRGGRMIITGRTKTGLRSKISKGTYLAIPVGRALQGKKRKNRAQVAKGSRIDRVALDIAGGNEFTTFVSKSGRALMMMVKGWRKAEPIAALKRSVTLPKRPVWARVQKLLAKKLPVAVHVDINKRIRKAS
jgi:hypothetical protein